MKTDTREAGPWEFGIKPVRRSQKTDWEEVWDKAKEGKLMEIPADIRLKSIFHLQQVSKMYMKVPPREGPKECWWFYGPPGTGKTRTAH